jgi:sulfite oxidase
MPNPKVQTHDAADEDKWWDKVPALMSNVLNSAIASVNLSSTSGSSGETEREGRAIGYAVGGAQGGQVERVEISLDAGRTWTEAQIRYKEGKWSWVIWEASFRVRTPGGPDKALEVWSRATDASGVVQLPECDWNLRGVAYNGYGKFAIPV